MNENENSWYFLGGDDDGDDEAAEAEVEFIAVQGF